MAGFEISIDDLPGIYREEYLYAVELARAQNDPVEDWESFRETLWSYLVRVFGVDEGHGASPPADSLEEPLRPFVD